MSKLVSKLAQIQQNFIAEIFQPKNFSDPRFQIYRQSLFENCRRALELTFPYLWSTLTDPRALVGHFLQDKSNWPTSGCLDDWGGKFPEFIYQTLQSTELKDLAQYEWLCNLSLMPPQFSAFDANDLMILSEEAKMNLHFRFQPSVYLHYTTFPLGKFLENFPKDKPHWVLIINSDTQLLTHEISPSWACFFKALIENNNLAKAYEKTNLEYLDFNLTEALVFLLEAKLCQK